MKNSTRNIKAQERPQIGDFLSCKKCGEKITSFDIDEEIIVELVYNHKCNENIRSGRYSRGVQGT